MEVVVKFNANLVEAVGQQLSVIGHRVPGNDSRRVIQQLCDAGAFAGALTAHDAHDLFLKIVQGSGFHGDTSGGGEEDNVGIIALPRFGLASQMTAPISNTAS